MTQAAPPRRPAPPPGGSSVTLSESEGIRYLHFGTRWVQGAMRIARPFDLELEYQQQMMLPKLFLPRPRRILQLGLGAAALTKACRRGLPKARITVVEIDPDVVRVARRWFRLPPPDRHLEVVVEDARDFLVRPTTSGAFDWLQVDLYDAAARGPVLDDLDFYRGCRAALASPGVAVFNLFGSRFTPSFSRIDEAFEGRAVGLPAVDAGNRIVAGFHGPSLDVAYADLHVRACEVELSDGWPATQWVGALRRSQRGHAAGRDGARMNL